MTTSRSGHSLHRVNLKIVQLETRVSDVNSFPKSPYPVVAFAGRSNVGKSSLINSLLNRKNIAQTSSAPGKTRRIDYFNINDKLFLADLPGYGYAKVSKTNREKWQKLIEHFLKNIAQICLVILIIDARRGITELDAQLIEWLTHYQRKFRIIITKCDKISKNEAEQVRRSVIQNEFNMEEPILFSAVDKRGKQKIWSGILSATSLKL